MRCISLKTAKFLAYAGLISLLVGGEAEASTSSTTRVPSVKDWPSCAHQPQGNVVSSFDLSKIDCNVGTVAFPGVTPIDRFPVTAHGKCRYIANTTGKSLFVPLKTDVEWTAFINNAVKIQGISLESCKVCKKESQNIVYVVDESGSIGQTRFDNEVRPFFGDLVDALHAEIQAPSAEVNNNSSLVQFGDASTVVAQHEKNDSSFSSAARGMGYKAGMTCLACGLKDAVGVLDNAGNSDENTIVLFTDGDATMTYANNANKSAINQDLENIAAEIKTKGYRLVIFGVGGYKRDELEKLLQNAGMSSSTNAALDNDGNQILFTTEDFSNMGGVTSSMVKTICVDAN